MLVEFECRRCKAKSTRPLEDCMKEQKESYQGLYDLRPPIGWQNGGFYHPLFCPDCKKAYEHFMEGGEEE